MNVSLPKRLKVAIVIAQNYQTENKSQSKQIVNTLLIKN